MIYKIHQNPKTCEHEWREVEGETAGPSLAVRKADHGDYVIDHVPTGLKLPGEWPTLACAMTVAGSIADKADWASCTDGDDAEANRRIIPKEVLEYMRLVSGSPRAWPFGGEPPVPPKVLINLDFSASLSVDELWPDGDWPDTITREAVLELINDVGGPEQAIREWNLGDNFDVSVHEAAMAIRYAKSKPEAGAKNV